MGTPMPIVSHFRGDLLYGLTLIEDTATIDEVAQACAAHSVGRRVAPQDRPLEVVHRGRVLDGGLTAAEAGLEPMTDVIVGYAAR